MEDVLDDLLADSDLPRVSASTNMPPDDTLACNKEPAAGLLQGQAPGLAKQESSAAWQATAGQHEMTPAPTRSSTTGGPKGQQHAQRLVHGQTSRHPTRLQAASIVHSHWVLHSIQSSVLAPLQRSTAALQLPPGRKAGCAPRCRPMNPAVLTLGAEPTRLQTTLSAITQQLSALEESLQPAAQPPRARMS